MSKIMGLAALLPLLVSCTAAIEDEGYGAGDEVSESSESDVGIAEQSLIQPGLINCDTGSQEVRALCKMALDRVNSELDARGVTVDSEGILFALDDPTDRKIDTGHACTVRAEQRHAYYSARLKRSASLDVSGNSLTRPLVIKLSLPVEYSAKIDVNQTFGYMILGSCNKSGSDSYSLKGSLATTADIVLGVDLNPTFGFRPNGDYAITIEPKVAVATALKNTNVDLRVSGVSPITPVVTFATGFSSTVAKSVTALFSGDSVSRIVEGSATWDFGAPVLLGIGALPRPLEDAMFGLIESKAAREIERSAARFGPGLEQALQQRLNEALKLENGKRVLIIRQDFLQQLTGGAAPSSQFVEVWRPQNPRAACEARASQQCWNDGARCEALSRACHAEEQEWLRQYPPVASTIVNATPMQPRYVSASP
ncbi:hypothetical protein WME90_34465 [Sorangium sp. So ce375]|uniref:hypothetical protein n=1 Tax=Sorangium sp. So ce375 TaxID=3133306 RepID=UPI003F5BEC9F